MRNRRIFTNKKEIGKYTKKWEIGVFTNKKEIGKYTKKRRNRRFLTNKKKLENILRKEK